MEVSRRKLVALGVGSAGALIAKFAKAEPPPGADPLAHSHPQPDVTELVSDLAGKAAVEHGHSGTYERVFGVEGYGSIASAIAAAEAAGGGVVLVSSVVALGATGVVLPTGVDLVCSGQGEITYSGSGVAVTFDNQTLGKSRVRVRRLTRDWGSDTDTTSVGVELLNCYWNEYNISQIYNFETGLHLRGSAAAVDIGTGWNTIAVGRIIDNKRGIRFSGSSTGAGVGFANSNTFVGGVVRLSGGLSGSYAGTRYIDLSQGNGNTFFATILEGSSGIPEKTVYIASNSNCFYSCRLEEAQVFEFGSASYGNVVDGGYGNWGPGTAMFVDNSAPKANIVRGARGMVAHSDSYSGTLNGGLAAYEGRVLGSDGDALFSTRNLADGRTAYLDGAGRLRTFTPGEAFERARLDSTGGGPGGYGGIFMGRGTADPSLSLGPGSDGFGLKTDNVFTVGTSATASRPSAASAGTGGQWYDTTLSKPIWSDGTVWRDAAGTAV